MSIQRAVLGAAGAIVYGMQGLKERQAEANKKAEEIRSAQKEQQQRFRQSPILNEMGENIMVPIQKTQQTAQTAQTEPKIQLFNAQGGKL